MKTTTNKYVCLNTSSIYGKIIKISFSTISGTAVLSPYSCKSAFALYFSCDLLMKKRWWSVAESGRERRKREGKNGGRRGSQIYWAPRKYSVFLKLFLLVLNNVKRISWINFVLSGMKWELQFTRTGASGPSATNRKRKFMRLLHRIRYENGYWTVHAYLSSGHQSSLLKCRARFQRHLSSTLRF